MVRLMQTKAVVCRTAGRPASPKPLVFTQPTWSKRHDRFSVLNPNPGLISQIKLMLGLNPKQ